MLRIDTTIVGYLAAAVMLVAGGLWIVFDSPSHPMLRQLVGGGGNAEPLNTEPPTREQISVMRKEVETARDLMRKAERQGGRAAMQDALKRYDQAQRRYTAARLQSLQSPGNVADAD